MHSTRVALWLKSTFREAVTMCSTTSSCNPACQERRSITECFPAGACAKAFCHRRLQTRNAAPNRPTFALRTCQFFLGTLCKIQLSLQSPAHFANLLRACQFFNVFNCKSSYTVRWCLVHICRHHLPKCSEHAIFLKFEVQIESKRALATVLCTFCRQLSQIAGRTRRNRHPTSAMKEATLPEKNTRFCAQNIFNPWIHAFPNCYSAPTRELLLLTICCHGAGLPFVRNSEVSIKFPLVILYVWYISRVVISS